MNRDELISIRLDLLKRGFPEHKGPELIAVSKKYPIEDIAFAYKAGQRKFGENRVDELIEKSKKAEDLKLDEIEWHFIGNLQSNKIPGLFSVVGLKAIHSVDSYSLLEKIYAKSNHLTRPLDYFLQMNTGLEKEKSGLETEDDLMKAANLALSQEGKSLLQLVGLMTMSKYRTANFKKDARDCFIKLKKFRKSLDQAFGLGNLKLSMGMSDDYAIAIEEGADYIRVGSAIFSEEKSH